MRTLTTDATTPTMQPMSSSTHRGDDTMNQAQRRISLSISRMSGGTRYDQARPEMLAFVPDSALRILDVGCATGRFGSDLIEARRNLEVWGIDPVPHPEGFPEPYRTRVTGSFPEDLPAAAGQFDCVVFNDVLEHLVDPWGVLAKTRALLVPGGSIVASIPNVRSVRVLRPLVLQGRWDYREYGILDRTHLRFFTRATIVEMVEAAGYRVVRVEPIRVQAGGKWAVANRLLRGHLNDFLAERFAVVGRLAD